MLAQEMQEIVGCPFFLFVRHGEPLALFYFWSRLRILARGVQTGPNLVTVVLCQCETVVPRFSVVYAGFIVNSVLHPLHEFFCWKTINFSRFVPVLLNEGITLRFEVVPALLKFFNVEWENSELTDVFRQDAESWSELDRMSLRRVMRSSQ